MFVINGKAGDKSDLKRIIAMQGSEILAKNERLKRVEDLEIICDEKEEKLQSWEKRGEKYETALRQADARIAHLSKQLGIDPQTTSDGVANAALTELGEKDTATKSLEQSVSVTTLKDDQVQGEDNIKQVESAKVYEANKEQLAKDEANKNKELYELVNTLKDDLAQREHHIKELESTLASKGDDLAAKVNELTKVNMKLERSAQAKQVFSEKLMNENEKVNANAAVLKEERENLLKQLKENEKILQEKQEKLHELERKNEELSERITELTTEVKKAGESKAECQKKCDGFFNQVKNLNTKQRESEDEISALKRSNENLRAQVSEKETLMIVMRDQLKSYEDDFLRENEEKNQIKKKFESKEQENERMRRENQSHTTTFQEKSKLLLENQQKQQELTRENEKLVNDLIAEVIKANASKARVQSELSETARKRADLQQKFDRLFSQLMRVYSKKRDEISRMQDQIDLLQRMLDESNCMGLPIQEQGEQ